MLQGDLMEQSIRVSKYDRYIKWFLSMLNITIGMWLLVATTADMIPELQKGLATVGCTFIVFFGLVRIPGKKVTN
jgi:hypothetical protein